ncbi:MAG: S23 ribosomal protein [uncultured bacterium]|nr:MAG: S23 ribosomal protein [uncultured bacterium]
MKTYSYKDLVVWQRAMDLVVAVYSLTEKYPPLERVGLVSQTRRSAVSIPSNIAEGRHRGTRRGYRQFLIIAYSSAVELETQIEITRRLPFGKQLEFSKVDALLDEVMRMLGRMISQMRS